MDTSKNIQKVKLSFMDKITGLVARQPLPAENKAVEIDESSQSPVTVTISDINPQQAFDRTMELYHAVFKEERKGLDYLSKRGIIDQEIYLDYKIGFVNGSLKRTLPQEGPMVEILKTVGILTDKGSELLYNCVVFPIYDEDGNVVSLYGRHIEKKEHVYLPGPHRSVFNIGALKISKKIFLTQSIIDSLSLIQMGIRETVPLYGMNGLTQDHMELFKKYQTRQVYLCLENTPEGCDASRRLAEEMSPLGIRCQQVTLPQDVKDLNDYLLLGGVKESFSQLVEQAVGDHQTTTISNQVGVMKVKVLPGLMVIQKTLSLCFPPALTI